MTLSFWSTRIWRARSPSVKARRVVDRAGSRRSISSATSSITAVLPLSKLAHTRLFSGRGGGGASPVAGREIGKRLSMTCCGVRTQGARVKTVAAVAIRFLLAFCPLVSRALGCAPQGLTMGMPLQSTAATRIELAAVATERCW